MTATHIEHPEDHTEREVLPFPIGFVDPAEQILSEDEVEPLEPKPYVPISKRYERWRLYRDPYGKWIAEQPNLIDEPMFVTTYAPAAFAPFTLRGYAYRHASHGRVLDALRLAVMKHEAAL